MKQKSFFKGIFGLIMLSFGLYLLIVETLALALYGSASIFFTYMPFLSILTPLTSIFATMAIVGLILGFGLVYYGIRWTVKNENPVIKMFIGIVGLWTMLLGIIVGIGTASTIIGIIFGGMIAITGLMFVQRGFGITIIPTLNKFYDKTTRMVTGGII